MSEIVRPSGQMYSFDVGLAAAYGKDCAILIHHLQHWISFNKRSERNFRDGRTWMYSTYKEIADHFPFYTREQVRYAINKLVEFGVIIKGNYNKLNGDCTVWFAFTHEEVYVPNLPQPKIPKKEIKQPDIPPLGNLTGGWENSQGVGKIPSAIPHTKPNTKPDINITNPTLPKRSDSGLVGGLPKQIKIYECLKNLDISEKDKIRLSKKFEEPIVQKAVTHCTKKSFKVQNSLDSSIFYFCQNPDHIKETKEEIQAKKIQEEDSKREKELQNYSIACHLTKVLWNQAKDLGINLYAKVNEYLEINSDRFVEKIYYSNDKFVSYIKHLLSKLGFEIPEFLVAK